jgi:hypothetical protein
MSLVFDWHVSLRMSFFFCFTIVLARMDGQWHGLMSMVSIEFVSVHMSLALRECFALFKWYCGGQHALFVDNVHLVVATLVLRMNKDNWSQIDGRFSAMQRAYVYTRGGENLASIWRYA